MVVRQLEPLQIPNLFEWIISQKRLNVSNFTLKLNRIAFLYVSKVGGINSLAVENGPGAKGK